MSVQINAIGRYGIEARAVPIEVCRGSEAQEEVDGVHSEKVEDWQKGAVAVLGLNGYAVPEDTYVLLHNNQFVPDFEGQLLVAMALLALAGIVPPESLKDRCIIGDVSSAGCITPAWGVFAQVLAARAGGIREAIVPLSALSEASLVPGIAVRGVKSLKDLVSYLRGEAALATGDTEVSKECVPTRSFGDVLGLDLPKRALAIAAAGGHPSLLIGAPGCGKSMLAERFASLLPPMSVEEIEEAAAIHSWARLPVEGIAKATRPYRAPHYSGSPYSLFGGGEWCVPGEVSLATNGVLFLDDLPEFRQADLGMLTVVIKYGRSRRVCKGQTYDIPARFQLLAAMNPCPCGRADEAGCRCSPESVERYRNAALPVTSLCQIQVRLPG